LFQNGIDTDGVQPIEVRFSQSSRNGVNMKDYSINPIRVDGGRLRDIDRSEDFGELPSEMPDNAAGLNVIERHFRDGRLIEFLDAASKKNASKEDQSFLEAFARTMVECLNDEKPEIRVRTLNLIAKIGFPAPKNKIDTQVHINSKAMIGKRSKQLREMEFSIDSFTSSYDDDEDEDEDDDG